MYDSFMSPQEVQELVERLDGADEARELEICEEYGFTPSYTWELMESQGYEWSDDRWQKREPIKR